MKRNTSVIVALVALFVLLSCKKDNDGVSSNTSLQLEQLGDLQSLQPYGFSFAGEPIIQLNNYQLYEWSDASRKWNQLGYVLAEPALKIVQDAAGNYIRLGSWLYVLNKTSNTWEKINLPENTGSSAMAQMAANAKGDIVVRLFSNNKFFYYKKEAAQTVWMKIKEVNKADDPWNKDRHLHFLSNTGILYYAGAGNLYDVVLHTSTGAFGLLFDRYAPDMITNFGQDGLLMGTNYIAADGTVYVMTEHINESWKATLWKLTPNNLPATINQVQKLELPALEHATNGWLTRAGGAFVVEASGNIRMYLSCQKYPDAHWFAVTAKIGSPGVSTFDDHPASQRGLVINQHGKVYVQAWRGYLYKWN